jgi:hypothetical protein
MVVMLSVLALLSGYVVYTGWRYCLAVFLSFTFSLYMLAKFSVHGGYAG